MFFGIIKPQMRLFFTTFSDAINVYSLLQFYCGFWIAYKIYDRKRVSCINTERTIKCSHLYCSLCTAFKIYGFLFFSLSLSLFRKNAWFAIEIDCINKIGKKLTYLKNAYSKFSSQKKKAFFDLNLFHQLLL